MKKPAALLAIGLILPLALQSQSPDQTNACIQRCVARPVDLELERQEIVDLEREGAHAILLGDATFFRRVYGDDFRGTLSHGESVDKAEYIKLVKSSLSKYQSFAVSDIQVRIYRDTAVATCQWSSRTTLKRESMQGQIRVTHVYVNGPTGWKLVSGQHTAAETEIPEQRAAHTVTAMFPSL